MEERKKIAGNGPPFLIQEGFHQSKKADSSVGRAR